MRKANPKKPRAQRKAQGRTKKRDSSLRARVEGEFSEAMRSAQSYVKSPDRLRALAREAARKASSMPEDVFKDTWAYFQAMLRLIRAYARGEYRQLPTTTLIIVIAAVIYVVNPFDFIPDWVPGLGFVDDAFILAFAVAKTKATLDQFMAWETSRL